MSGSPPALPRGVLSARTRIVAAGTFALSALERKVVEAAYTDDRQWFEDHPDRDERIRPALPDEIPAEAAAELGWDLATGPEEAWFVRVTRGPSGEWREYVVNPLPVPDFVRLDPIEGLAP